MFKTNLKIKKITSWHVAKS